MTFLFNLHICKSYNMIFSKCYQDEAASCNRYDWGYYEFYMGSVPRKHIFGITDWLESNQAADN